MRILHLADRWTDRGGAYQYLSSRIAAQLEDSHEVELWVGGLDPEAPAAPCETRIVPGLAERVAAPVELPSRSFELVNLHNVVNPMALERVGALEAPRKRVTVQDHRFFCPGRGKLTAGGEVCREPMSLSLCRGCFTDEAYYREIFRLTMDRLSALQGFEVEVLSRYMKTELVAVGVPAERIEVVPPVVTMECEPSSPSSYVLFVGRLVEAKGVWDAVEAWRRADVGLPLVFAGTGPLRAELERRGHEVLGWRRHGAMAAIYAAAAAVVLPSRWQEPFGIAGLEAQSLGVPVVAWESGAVSEWHRGPRVAWGDVNGLARELRASCLASRRAPR